MQNLNAYDLDQHHPLLSKEHRLLDLQFKAERALAQGQLAEAIPHLEAILHLDAQQTAIHRALGNLLLQVGRPDKALPHLEQAAERLSPSADTLSNLALARLASANTDGAFQAARRALEQDPTHAHAWNQLGSTYLLEGRAHQAEQAFRESLRSDPSQGFVHANLAESLREQGRLEASLLAYDEGLARAPGDACTALGKAMALLTMGRYPEGWMAYEQRWRAPEFRETPPPEPHWNGRLRPGLRLQVHPEQGSGDNLQFLRYLPWLAKQGLKVTYRAPRPLARLARLLPGVTVDQAGTDRADAHISLLSLPHVCGTTLTSLPPLPPLHLPGRDREAWRARMAPGPERRIGLAWRGHAGHGRTHLRDIPVEAFAPLAELKGVSWHTIQPERAPREIDHLREMGLPLQTHPGLLEDFLDTACLLSNLDLVVTADTAVAHLAGLLQIPVRLLLRAGSEWRWMQHREDSPWYPSMRIFRQTEPGDWRKPIAALATELAGANPCGRRTAPAFHLPCEASGHWPSSARS